MAASVVDNKSNSTEDNQLPCSSSSLSPVNNIEPMEGVEHESPVQQNMEGVEHESSTPSNEKKNDFEIGDIVWAKIGRHPFWPSMVCIDPETNVYIKGSLENKKQFSLHVRFCNDHGRRSWAKTVEMYSGKDEFLSKYPNGLALIKNSKKQMEVWDGAVKEADNWMKVNNRDERMVRFTRRNGLSRSKISGLGPKTRYTPKTFNAPTPSTSAAIAVTPQEFLDMQKALKTSMSLSCQPSTSGTSSQGINCEASTSGSNMRSCYVQLKDIKKKPLRKPKVEEDEDRAIPLPKVQLPIPEPPKPKPAKRKYVDVKKIALREALKKKKAKRALQVKKYGFSYSSSEYESTDDEAVPLVPFKPNRKVLESIKYAVANLESEGMQRQKEKRILIKAIRLAERRKSKKNKDEEEEEEQEQEQEQ
ncbi:uncharacterized protein LOC132935070 isoform X2 [Metopolophium dirhodum]|uniref:uncharacterized protein LOC132935070 isoform X2 n=1 Tax=Metopolophium dirhodum TaxID=44670 RepID=UPI00298F9A63|nr:uncharacterized protein LOC132935070 isoform X2 [Metopolophium dirhodum]XP_060857506.1 uncharacterized protein LOC132935070 isoform X2 [Metopolophium dirhodum]XP_060857507.1 uncharacterized protein LOC132935070 isoform X2 [Metopolophium dirhodum]